MPLYPLLRPLLFRLEPERAHALSLLALELMGAVPPLRAMQRRLTPRVEDPVEALGLRFANRVGLAAGYDKDARALHGLAALGFGHLEVGTVTPRPQAGNPRPRVFRLVEDRSVINRLGFPSQGAPRVAARLRRRPAGVVVGVNLGKQRETPVEGALGDYLELLDTFAPLADYLTVNVSSPNTPGLRRLQSGEELAKLLAPLVRRRDELASAPAAAGAPAPRPPLLVKLSPDLAAEDLDEAVDAALAAGIDGFIATNTTLTFAKVLQATHLTSFYLIDDDTDVPAADYQCHTWSASSPQASDANVMMMIGVSFNPNGQFNLVSLESTWVNTGPIIGPPPLAPQVGD